MAKEETNPFLEGLANALKDQVDGLISGTNISYSEEPEVVQRDIIEYESRMRIDGMSKFNKPSFISYVNFYKSEGDQKNHNAIGAVVVYIEVENSTKLLKTLGYTVRLDDDDDVVMEQCGEFLNSVVETFKGELSSKGYGSLVASEVHNSINDVAEGIEFDYDEYLKYEVNFYAWKEKILSFDITLSPPK